MLPRNCCSLRVPFLQTRKPVDCARRHSAIELTLLTVSWTLYYYVGSITVHKSKKIVHATKIVFNGSDIVLSQLVTWSREIEFIRVECAQTMTKT